MSEEKDKLTRVKHLSVLALEGVITEEEFVELEGLLSKDPDSRECYFEMIKVSLSLRQIRDAAKSVCNSEEPEAGMDTALWQALAANEKSAVGVEVERKSELDNAPVLINFKSTNSRFNKVKNWGTMLEFK